MWKCATLALLLAFCGVVAPAEPPAEVDKDADVCAMTEVLVAMKKLLILLSTEIRDLREQVRTSCQSGGTIAVNTTTSPSTVVEPVETQAPVSQEASSTPVPATTDAPDDDLDDKFTIQLEEEEEEEEDFDYVDPEENPVSEVISGVSNWWKTFSLFSPKSTTDATTEGQTDEDDYKEEEDEYEDAEDLSTKAPERTTTATTSTTSTTTTTTPRPYTLPPPPTSCPTPFKLIAEGCYLVVHNSRDWRSWGDAYSFCQNYGGRLASPWRLPQLQEYLALYYSDAFWVGARLITTKKRWEWLTGRKVEQEEWKPGQPSRNPGKKCVFLDKWSNYHANNFFCGEKYPFICESNEV